MATDTEDRAALAPVDDDDGLPFDPADFPFDLEEFPMDESSVKDRHDNVTYPYAGGSIWLAPFPVPTALIEGASSLMGKMETKAESLPMIRKGIGMCVAGHTLRDPRTGEYFDQFWNNPAALEDVPFETLFDLVSVIQNGEISEARKNGSSGGRAGTTTRRSTGKKILRTSTGRARR